MTTDHDTLSAWRQNPLIVASIALPLLVVALFASASILPKLITEAPQYSLVYVLPHYDPAANVPASLDVTVDAGRIVATVVHRNENSLYPMPAIFLYEPENDTVRRLDIEVPEDWSQPAIGARLPVTGIGSGRIDPSLKAPDGYEFRDVGYRSGLLFDLFGAGGRRGGISIVKNGAVRKIPLPAGHDRWYGPAAFLGWVVD